MRVADGARYDQVMLRSRVTRTIALAAAVVFSSTIGGFPAQHYRSASAAGPIPAGYVGLNPGRVYDSRGPAFTNPRHVHGGLGERHLRPNRCRSQGVVMVSRPVSGIL